MTPSLTANQQAFGTRAADRARFRGLLALYAAVNPLLEQLTLEALHISNF